jgi:hypothetical protein
MVIQAGGSLFFFSKLVRRGMACRGLHKGNWFKTGCFYEITKNRDRKWDEKIWSASSQLAMCRKFATCTKNIAERQGRQKN